MYRALYDYAPDASVQGGLQLSADERYLLVDSSNKHWWRVQRCRDSQLGLAPASYLEQVKEDNSEVYRVKYDFEGSTAMQLSSKKGDLVTVVSKESQEWWTARNASGRFGLIPANYLKRKSKKKSSKSPSPASEDTKSPSEILQTIDESIESIHKEAASSGGVYTAAQKGSLRALVGYRKDVSQGKIPDVPLHSVLPPPDGGEDDDAKEATKVKRRAPEPPDRGASLKRKDGRSEAERPLASAVQKQEEKMESTGRVSSSGDGDKEVRTAPEPSLSPARQISSPQSADFTLGRQLIDLVRERTALSYDNSAGAIDAVLTFLKAKLPEVAAPLEPIAKSIAVLQVGEVVSGIEGGSSKDRERLDIILSELKACKDDSQQRSWALHDDYAVIVEYLEELLTLLSDADRAVSQSMVQRDGYDAVDSLVTYYQMETRAPIRLLLLKVFGALCDLDHIVISILLASLLPMELARDITNDLDNVQKTLYSSLVCTMILSTGEAPPLQLYDHWSLTFVEFLFENIESPPDCDVEEQIPDSFTNMILSYNLHFTNPQENLVMQVLGARSTAKAFSEKVLMLFNREDDPVALLRPLSPNSVLKLLLDIFSTGATSGLFFTTDLMVLIDITVRQIADLSLGDERRTHYLRLLKGIIGNTDYQEHKHRLDDIIDAFHSICQEERGDNDADYQIVTELSKRFPLLFDLSTAV
eukprot:m.146815 g.146815  ORF g.146815 m.146815 type:complete len:700 (+) comp38454_c1_seq4:14-2113(+)